jgi:nucleotide-binding universal stress UspA family protein
LDSHTIIIGLQWLIILGLAASLWAMRRPPKMAPEIEQTYRSVRAVRRILVPIRGFSFEERAVELACRLGAEQKSEIVLACVLEVPLTLSLGAALPDDEARAMEALARASMLVRAHGLTPIERVERDRDAGRGILKLAKELGIDLVVVGMDPNRGIAINPIGPTTESLLRKADFEVLFDRTAPQKF